MGIQQKRRLRMSSQSGSITPGVPDTAEDTVITRIGTVVQNMSALIGDGSHPMARVIKRTVRDMLTEMAEQIEDGKLHEDVLRTRAAEFAAAIKWVTEAPVPIAPAETPAIPDGAWIAPAYMGGRIS